jgi:DNA-binding IclR family transcriptional regulator
MILGSQLVALLEMLGDGKWHRLAELQQQVGLDAYKVQGIAEFLCRFGFAVVDEVNRQVRVSRDFKEFLART